MSAVISTVILATKEKVFLRLFKRSLRFLEQVKLGTKLT